ncbi:MAG: aminotransferase class I/II-fold pyridoxal phosphate-dependent enzyme [Ilumatobacteraceae bacterium]
MTAPTAARTGGFVPPPYPYDRLARFAPLAERHEGGLVDLSVGTPVDPPAEAVVAALGGSDTERGYPPSIGSVALRAAFARWIDRRFDVGIDPDHIGACIGTKELVASTPHLLRLRSPWRDTVLHPAVAYPTYAMGAELAGCRAVPVPPTESGELDLDAISRDDAERALLIWSNSPSNPTGALDDLERLVAWGRRNDVPVFSDECYAEFTWEGWPRSVLQHATQGVVAVHSLSKRSNLAGVRVGCYAGDPELVGYLQEVRKHMGMMVPGPAQAAAVAALDDDAHVEVQRDRYRRRLERAARVLGGWASIDITLPAGGFYLWFDAGDGWAFAERLARAGGALVSPGDFYGGAGSQFVRVAVVQPDDRLDLVARRLSAGGHGTGGG